MLHASQYKFYIVGRVHSRMHKENPFEENFKHFLSIPSLKRLYIHGDRSK